MWCLPWTQNSRRGWLHTANRPNQWKVGLQVNVSFKTALPPPLLETCLSDYTLYLYNSNNFVIRFYPQNWLLLFLSCIYCSIVNLPYLYCVVADDTPVNQPMPTQFTTFKYYFYFYFTFSFFRFAKSIKFSTHPTSTLNALPPAKYIAIPKVLTKYYFYHIIVAFSYRFFRRKCKNCKRLQQLWSEKQWKNINVYSLT